MNVGSPTPSHLLTMTALRHASLIYGNRNIMYCIYKIQLLTSNSTKQSPMEIGTLCTFLSVHPKQTHQVLLPRQNYSKQWCHKLSPDKLFSKQHTSRLQNYAHRCYMAFHNLIYEMWCSLCQASMTSNLPFLIRTHENTKPPSQWQPFATDIETEIKWKLILRLTLALSELLHGQVLLRQE